MIACGKGFRMRFGKKGIGAVASITAAAALLTCLVPVALADNGGGGSGEGGGGDHGGPSQTADVHWIYKDSWPATLDGMKSALSDANVTLSSDLSDGANEYVDMNKTLSDAIDECRRSYTGEGNADCRMVAVGYARLGNGARPDRPPDTPPTSTSSTPPTGPSNTSGAPAAK